MLFSPLSALKAAPAVWSLSIAAAAKIARVLLAIYLALLDRFFFSFFTKRDPPVKRVAVIGGGIAGFGAAWALARSGVEVTLLEAATEVGGNAKTIAWPDGKVTGLSVLAWPAVYFRNYKSLLRALGIETAPVELPFYIRRADGEAFAHGRDAHLSRRYAGDLRRWSYLVAFVRRVNAFFAGKGAPLSLYHMSLLNPLNAVPLRLACALFGISAGFYHDLIVPLYASSFLSTDLAMTPLVIVPIIDDLISTHAVPSMESWKASSRDVFSRMAADTACIGALKVRAGRRVGFAYRDPADGRWSLTCIGAEPEFFSGFDRVVFAAGARAAADALPNTWAWTAARLLLRSVAYCGGPAFAKGVVHSDATVLPADLRTDLLRSYANYIEEFGGGGGAARRYENTFILSSWYPAVQSDGDDEGENGRLSGSDARPPPMARLVTYDCRHPERLKGVVGEVRNEWNHPVLSPLNLLVALLLRLLQGRRGAYYAGSMSTPGNGHDLSLCSGFAAAAAIGADYPFAADPDAAADFARLRGIMGL